MARFFPYLPTVTCAMSSLVPPRDIPGTSRLEVRRDRRDAETSCVSLNLRTPTAEALAYVHHSTHVAISPYNSCLGGPTVFLIKIVRISDGKLGKIGAVLTYSICYDDCAPVAVIAEAETATGSGRT
jgi:hypothetical protein